MIPSFLFLPVLLFLSAFFSSIETAFTSLSLMQIQDLKTRYKKRGPIVEELYNQPGKLLTTILIANNLANISISVISSAITIQLFGSSLLGLTTAVLTMVILMFGEILPKHIAIKNNEAICINTARIIKILSLLFLPVIKFINGFTALFIRHGKNTKRDYFTPDSILHMVKHAEHTGKIENYKTKMLQSVLRFSDISVHSIMTHRQEVFSLNENLSVKQALSPVIDSGFSRIPVYNENPEIITGIVLTKNLTCTAAIGNQETILAELLSPPVFIPETWNIHRVFLKLKEEFLNIGIVLDEYGGLSGIVTMEDLVEEIIGELYDEHEELDEAKIQKSRQDGWYDISGDTPIHLLEEIHGTPIDHDRNSETAGGYVLQQLSALPVTGQRIETKIGIFVIHSMHKKRVQRMDYLPSEKP